MKANQHQRGFGVIGVIIVMLVVGAAATLLPRLLLSKHTQSNQLSDLQALQAAKTAVISDALSKGVMPAVGAVTASCSRGGMPASLGVNNWGIFGKDNIFCIDVTDSLLGFTPPTSIPVTSTLCTRAKAELNLPVAGPRICQDTSRATPNCAISAPMAFVLYSLGNDRAPNQQNDEASAVMGVNNRVYENDLRGINNAPEAAGSVHYDDQVVSYPLAQLIKDCATVPEPVAPACPGGQKKVVLTSASSQDIYHAATASPPSCTELSSGGGTQGTIACQDMSSFYLFRNGPSSCTQSPGGSYLTDVNSDGVVTISCTGTGSGTSCTSN